MFPLHALTSQLSKHRTDMATDVSWHLHLRAAQTQRPQVSLLPWEALSDDRKYLFGGHLATAEHQHPTEVT